MFKRTVREAAMRHNMYATFMAKPIAGQPGSAMHIHQSVIDTATGRNVFADEDGSDSALFKSAIAGLQTYLPASMALFAPYVNSYRRLVPDTAAPINVQWGRDNRTVGIRVPHSSAAARRLENRVVGADANPYIALATSLACCYLGMVNGLVPSEELKGNGYAHDYELPRSLNEAIDLLREATPLRELLGEQFVTLYTSVKELEYTEFMRVISPWEREHLLLHV